MRAWLERRKWPSGRNLIPLLLVLMVGSTQSDIASGAVPTREHPIPRNVNAELEYLLRFVGTNRIDPGSLDSQRIANVLGFIVASKPADMLYVATPHNGTTAAYLEIDVRRSLPDAVRFAYDPELPASLSAPSTVHKAHWKYVDRNALKALWETPISRQVRLSVVGMEHLVNTPDSHTGAYYGYDLDRTLLRIPHQKDAVLISLSAQRGRSDVGLQGLILGPDEQWNYVYTDKRGLRWPGLGWVDSYLYDSYSAAIYVSLESSASSTRLAVFKWLRAGWGGLNVVSSQHIHDGLNRFGRAFKKIVENPGTANIDKLSRTFAIWKQQSTEELRRIVALHFSDLSARFPGSSPLENPEYLTTLTRNDLLAIVHLEQTKASLGMSSVVNGPTVRNPNGAAGR